MARPHGEAKMLGSLQENSFYATKQKIKQQLTLY
jgi:hypothetical protein